MQARSVWTVFIDHLPVLQIFLGFKRPCSEDPKDGKTPITPLGETSQGIFRKMGTNMQALVPSQLPNANIVVTCTKRKRRLPEESLKFRHVTKASIEEGFDVWVERILDSGDDTLPPRGLYAGDHWSVAVSLEHVAEASGFKAAIWVCSAGYGLVGIDSRIKPYSATFSSSHPDTVCRWGDGRYRRGSKETWWQLQTEWPGPDPAAPRSIAGLAAADPRSPLIVVASRDYMEGILNDCIRAREELADSDLLSIVSAGSRDLPGLSANLLPSDVSLRRTVGGSVRALNIRVTRRILSEVSYYDLRASVLYQACSRLVAQASRLPAISRAQTSDDEVRDFILAMLEQHRMTGRTALLQRLRESGRACSQNRFSRIFDSAAQTFFHGA